MNAQTTTTGTPPIPPPNGYPIGTILHGNSPRIGNLWIITVDNSFQAALLYDGKLNFVCPDSSYKTDRMSPGMRIADGHDVALKVGKLPTWATSLILTTHKPVRGFLQKPSTTLPHGVLQQINKSFAAITPQKKLNDLGLTKPKSYGGFQSIFADDEGHAPLRDCPARKEGYCLYEPYYGFTDTYEYCVHCDHKRTMRK